MQMEIIHGDPEISVIVPVYNSEKYLRRNIESLLSQSTDDFEIIMVNDGSEDSSLEIIREYSNKYKKIRIINMTNRGVSAARNNGLDYAAGKYISFVDSDDFVSKFFLESLHQGIKKYDADISCCNYYSFHPKGKISVPNFLTLRDGIYTSEKILNYLIRDVSIHYHVWNKLWKKSLFRDSRIKFPNMCFEDMIVSLKLFRYAKKISVDSSALYYYSRNGNSLGSLIDRKRFDDYIYAFSMIRNFLESEGIYKKYKASHTALGLRMILSSVGPIRNIVSAEGPKVSFFKEFGKTVQKIMYIMGNNYKIPEIDNELYVGSGKNYINEVPDLKQ